jgi:hypothetical protein
VIFQGDFFVPREARSRLLRGKNRFDLAVAHRDGMVLQDRARRLDRDDPAGAEEEGLFRYLGVP